MKASFNPMMEVIRFTTEDVIVTSGGSTSGTADPVRFIFEAGTPYFARGDEINESLSTPKVKDGFYYYFTPSADADTFIYDKSKNAQNDIDLKSGYIYAWYKDTGWYSEGKMKDAYPLINGKYDFPTD